MCRFAFPLLTATAFLAASATAQPADGRRLLFGAATSNITPWIGDALVGNFVQPAAEHIHDELHARCFVLDDGTTRIALVVSDSLYMSREVLDEAKRQTTEATGLAADRMLMACTHTHSSVSARSRNPLQPGKDFTEYQQFVARRIADGVRRAIHNMQPARIAWGTADLPGQVFCRRWLLQPGTELFNPFGESEQVKMNPGNRPDLLRPAGPVDPQIAFLAFANADGRPLGLLANYSLHYVGGTGPQEISADYFGVFADRIQRLLGADRLDPPFVGAMSNGTSANINNSDYSKPRAKRKPYEQIRLVADQCAQAVFEQYDKLAWHDWVPLGMRQCELELGVRKPTPQQLAHARQVLADPDRPDQFPHERSYARRAIQQAKTPATIRVLLQAVRIGELGVSAIPFEVFSETGLELKARSPFRPSFTMELANGAHGYLPTPEQHRLGGYETWLGTSRAEEQASVKIVEALLGMFAELKD